MNAATPSGKSAHHPRGGNANHHRIAAVTIRAASSTNPREVALLVRRTVSAKRKPMLIDQ